MFTTIVILSIITIGVVVLLKINYNAKRRAEEEERNRLQQCREKYTQETPARRALIIQLYHERLDLKEITFILRKAGYKGISCEEITMKEIMDEHAQIQLDKHKGTGGEGEKE